MLSLLSITSFLPCLLGADFSVYWNLFTGHCKTELDPLLKQYRIIQNKNHKFRGEKIALFYEFNHGRYPYYKNFKIDDPIYGGSPQNLSKKGIKRHLDVSEHNITEHIKDKYSSGLGILDFEEWRPLYNMNINSKKVYQEAAIKITRTKHNDSIQGGKELTVTAAQEFNIAARRFIHKSLVQARRLRKKTLWGMYGLPYCNYDAGTKESEKRCSGEFQRFNDKLMYIYNASQALYPSIYLNLKERSDKERSFRYVQAIVAEAQRIAHKREPRLPVYAYTKIEYDPRNYNCSFYDPEDLCTTFVLPYRMGVDGIILWSSSNGMTYRCKILTKFLKEKLGPFLQDVVNDKYGARNRDYDHKRVWDYDTVCKPYISNITSYGSPVCDDDVTTTARPST